MRLKASTKSSTKLQPSTSARALMMSSKEHHRTQRCSQLFLKGSAHSSLIVPKSRFANSSLDSTKNAVGTEPWLTDKGPRTIHPGIICNCVEKTSGAWIQTRDGGGHVSAKQELHMHLWTARLVFLRAVATWEGGYDCSLGAPGVPTGRG